MKRVKLVVSYDGTAYGGSQRQKNTRTIQQTLEEALRRVLKEKTWLSFAGRTDAGVHAEGQVATFTTHRKIPLQGLRRALNAMLPKDIVVRSVAEVPVSFHPRFRPSLKEYRYTIWNHPVPTPFLREYTFHVPHPLNLAAMRKAARLLVGKHDFKSFQASDKKKRSSVRTLRRLSVRRKGPLIQMSFQGNGFVYHMVRNIVGTLLDVGRNRSAPEEIFRILSQRDRRLAGPTAPAKGLCLISIYYHPTRKRRYGPSDRAAGF